MVKRIIFDVDYTLLKPNYSNESEFFQKWVSSDNEYFLYHMYEILTEYEQNYARYEMNNLLKHLNKYSNGIILGESFYKAWLEFIMDLEEQDVQIVHGVLSYLKEKYELAVLTN